MAIHEKQRLAFILMLFVVAFQLVPLVKGEELTATLIPNHGKENASIYLKIRGTMTDASLNVYWDDSVLVHNFGQNIPVENEPGAGFDYTFNVPSEKPFSDIGTHSVSVEVNYNIFVEQPRLHKEARSFTATLDFEVEGEIIDYEQLYNDLNTEFESLSSEYAQLESHELEMQSKVSELESELETLSQNLQSVEDIQSNYNNLLQDYAELTSNYSDLLESVGDNPESPAIPGFPIEVLVFGISAYALYLRKHRIS